MVVVDDGTGVVLELDNFVLELKVEAEVELMAVGFSLETVSISSPLILVPSLLYMASFNELVIYEDPFLIIILPLTISLFKNE